MLRGAKANLARGETVSEAARKIGVAEQTYSLWKREYAGHLYNQAKRLKDLENENTCLECLFADAELGKTFLCESASGRSGATQLYV